MKCSVCNGSECGQIIIDGRLMCPTCIQKGVMRLKNAIRNDDAFVDGYCIVCMNHINGPSGHSKDCPMREEG